MINSISIGKAAKLLGVSVVTVRRWEKLNKIKSFRTIGNHRRFYFEDVVKIQNKIIRKITLASLLISLAGCSSFDAKPVPLSKKPILNTKVLVSIENNVRFKNRYQRGEALRYYDPHLGLVVCKIKLFEYPYLLGHEMDHCFRGKWHDDEENGDDFN